MVRIGYMSDLHLRFNGNHEEFISGLMPDVDVQIIAGDVIDGVLDIDVLRQLLKRFTMPVVFVPGNHEFFCKSIEPFSAERRLKNLEREFPNLHVLIGETWQMPDGPRFVGTTLWYTATGALAWRNSNWADIRIIPDIGPYTVERSAVDDALLDGLEEGDVVVTHMLPSWKCVDPRFAGAPNNELFVRDVERRIRDARPALWVHGHTHAPVDLWIGETRVLCNPRGTIRNGVHENPEFDPHASIAWPVAKDVPGGPLAVIK